MEGGSRDVNLMKSPFTARIGHAFTEIIAHQKDERAFRRLGLAKRWKPGWCVAVMKRVVMVWRRALVGEP
eukprot:2802377-Prymnesium_polylepis.2